MSKLLAEFLQEQQEPFALEVYLVERGHPLNAKFTLHNSAEHVAPNCSYFLRTVFNHFVVDGGRKDFLIGVSKKSRRANAAESSSSSNTTLFNSCSHRCGNCFLGGKQTNSKLRRKEDGKQLSPVSVLGETDEDSLFHYKEYCNLKRQRESSNLISQCRVEQQYYDEYIINKKALRQRKQLLIDCRKEVIEKYRKKEKNKEIILGGGEIWKHVWIWSQECINKSNIVNLLHSDFVDSEDEWNAVFEDHKFQISMEIENSILENVIIEIMTLL